MSNHDDYCCRAAAQIELEGGTAELRRGIAEAQVPTGAASPHDSARARKNFQRCVRKVSRATKPALPDQIMSLVRLSESKKKRTARLLRSRAASEDAPPPALAGPRSLRTNSDTSFDGSGRRRAGSASSDCGTGSPALQRSLSSF